MLAARPQLPRPLPVLMAEVLAVAASRATREVSGRPTPKCNAASRSRPSLRVSLATGPLLTNLPMQPSVTAMPAALPTVASRPKRARVPAEEVEARAVDAVVPLTDTAAPLEGENRYMPCSPSRPSFLTKSCSDSEKQAGHGWGANEGEAELKDEQAGEAIAKAEQKEGEAADADAEAEPEDTSISYSEYLAQLAEKKLQLGAGVPEARKPNEGSKQDKKWATAKPISKEDEEDFVAGSGGKAKR
jgi:hypothetical protein